MTFHTRGDRRLVNLEKDSPLKNTFDIHKDGTLIFLITNVDLFSFMLNHKKLYFQHIF